MTETGIQRLVTEATCEGAFWRDPRDKLCVSISVRQPKRGDITDQAMVHEIADHIHAMTIRELTRVVRGSNGSDLAKV